MFTSEESPGPGQIEGIHENFSSGPPYPMAPTAMPPPPTSGPTPRSSSGGLPIGALVNPYNVVNPYNSHYSLPTSMVPFSAPVVPFNLTSSDDYFTSEGSQSPASEQFGGYRHRQSISSASSVIGFDHSAASPLINSNVPGGWGPAPSPAPPSVLPSSMFEDMETTYVPVSDLGFCVYAPTETDQSQTGPGLPIPLSDLDGHDWSVIRRELSSATGIIPVTDSNGLSDTIRWYCLELYWQHFHPTFPIVHRPTFLPAKPSPLLASAMVAIGSVYDARDDAHTYALALLDISTKLLRGRKSVGSRSRLVDQQTVVLLEVLSKYCSRRVDVQMSPTFRTLFVNLKEARSKAPQSPLVIFKALPASRTAKEVGEARNFWVEHESRRRLWQASVVVDAQHAALFEQQHTIKQYSLPKLSTRDARSVDQLPCSDSLWETSPVEEWAGLASSLEYKESSSTTTQQSNNANAGLDFFQYQVQHATTGATGTAIHGDFVQPIVRASTVFVKTTTDFQAQFHNHAYQLATSTPIRHLLMISGESWVFGKKIDDEQEFEEVAQSLRLWVNQGKNSLIALWHATALLRSITTEQISSSSKPETFTPFKSTGMLYENWCIYLAVLVCWAHGFRASLSLSVSGATSVRSGASNVSSSSGYSAHPTLLDPAEATADMQEYLAVTDVDGPEALRTIGQTALGRMHGLLETVRMYKIGPAMGGLMNEAETVLYRLVQGKSILFSF